MSTGLFQCYFCQILNQSSKFSLTILQNFNSIRSLNLCSKYFRQEKLYEYAYFELPTLVFSLAPRLILEPHQ